MTTATAPAPTLHVVRARDAYDTRRCHKCRRPVAELDCVAVEERTVTHAGCLSRRALAAVTATMPSVPGSWCWYQDCLLTASLLSEVPPRLCSSHYAILYGAPLKKPARRQGVRSTR